MILKPLPEQANFRDPARAVLVASGLLAPSKESDAPFSITEILDNHGADLETAAVSLASALKDDNQRLKAIELVWKAHGILKEADKPSVPSINIVVQNSENGKTLIQFLSPKETQNNATNP